LYARGMRRRAFLQIMADLGKWLKRWCRLARAYLREPVSTQHGLIGGTFLVRPQVLSFARARKGAETRKVGTRKA
jgi:hypothetical protein